MGQMPRIESITAFLQVDEDGDEGVLCAHTGFGAMPLIAADATRLEEFRPLAEHTAREKGVTIRLARFSSREDIEVIDGA